MLKSLNKKTIALASAATITAVFSAGCMGGATPANDGFAKKPSIDGGVSYPIVGNATGPYKVNTKAHELPLNYGRVPTANEVKAWDKDIQGVKTGNRGLPEGSGSVEDGEALYEAQCVMCHGDFGSGGGGYPALSKGNAEDMQQTLKNQRNLPDNDGPVRVFGSYWPQASTLWWYIRDAMPHTKSKTLTADETYALSAYILNINEMSIDGEEVDEEYVLDREKFLKIRMPNEDGFVPSIDGPEGPENVRKFYANPDNYGAKTYNTETGERCMTNCQTKTAEVVRIQNGGISEFFPAMSVERNLPAKPEYDQGFNVKKSYIDNCMPCHGTDAMGAPVTGEKDDWEEVVAKGMDKVYINGINGINGMPPKGGASVSDAEFKMLVDYMIEESK
jgi:cytochrome c